jgi:hypothetical protein
MTFYKVDTSQQKLEKPSFSSEITTTVLWLNDQGIDIRCLEIKLYDINNEKFLNIEQIIPLPSVQNYQVKIREKTNQVVREASNRKKREETIKILVKHGKLLEGTRIYLKKSPNAKLNLDNLDIKIKGATFQAKEKKFKWDFDSEIYDLTPLCKKICKDKGVSETKASGLIYWAIEDQEKSLSEYAEELLQRDIDINT